MNNPFNLSDDKLKELLAGYTQWLKSDSKEARYPEEIRAQSEKIKAEFLGSPIMKDLTNDSLYDRVFKYSRNLEGRVHRTLPADVMRNSIGELRRNLDYILTSDDTPFIVAQTILDGKYRIKAYAKAFWSPILLARFPGILPNWNNKTEDFLIKVGVDIKNSKLSISEKYKKISEAFTYLMQLVSGHDFYTINHLMHYGTAIKEGSDLIAKLRNVVPNTDPVQDLIHGYKEKVRKIGLQDELYKWELLKTYKGRPDLKSQDFFLEIEKIDFQNFLYPMARIVKDFIAKGLPEEYRNCLANLFNEEVELATRVNEFMSTVDSIYRKLIGKHGHHHDERTISAFLTYHNPDKYTFFLDSFYQKYCKLIGINPEQKGDKYVHYMGLVYDLRDNYINNDRELITLIEGLKTENCYEDNNHLILAQDILFQMLGKDDNKNRKYWRIGTTDDDDDYWEEMLENEYVSVGWSKLGDISGKKTKTRQDILLLLNEAGYYIDKKHVGSRKAGELNDYLNVMRLDDVVLAQSGTKIRGIGIVNGPDGYNANSAFSHTKGVDWRIIDEIDFENRNGLNTTVFPLTDPELLKKINNILNGEESILNGEISNALTDIESKNIILYGPPGTGKTYHSIDKAVEIAAHKRFSLEDHEKNKEVFDELRKNGQVEFVTFHQNYSYEDFVIGIVPDVNSGILRFDQRQGIFKTLSDRATVNWQAVKSNSIASDENEKAELKRYVLVIDEINRANISRVFGELITLLEEDKRLGEPNELRVTLPTGEKDFGIPPNLYLVGTMNTADKSIALVDIALRRRFEFIGYYPKYELLDLESANLLRTINNNIYEKKKSADFLIGHAYFMKNQSIETVLKTKVIPLLMEYFSCKTDLVKEIFTGSELDVNYDPETYNWLIKKI